LLREALDVLLPLFCSEVGTGGSTDQNAAAANSAAAAMRQAGPGKGGQLALLWPKYTKKVLTEDLQSVNTQVGSLRINPLKICSPLVIPVASSKAACLI
jgi:hypothetical protein